jgi:DNA-binding NarL/FixJ family response regulator
MEPLRVVLYQNDPGTAEILAVSLSQHFESVYMARSSAEAGLAILQHRAEALVLDLEAVDWAELERLRQDFPRLCIVGTHRLADEELWTAALNQGASDICEPRQDDVVRSVLQGLTQRAVA